MHPLLQALLDAGVIKAGDANALDAHLQDPSARGRTEREMLTQFAAALSAQRDRLVDAVRANQGLLGTVEQNKFWAKENTALWESVKATLLDVAGESAMVATVNSNQPHLWTLINDDMIAWTNSYYTSTAADDLGSIPNLNQTSRQMVAGALQQWQEGLLPEQVDGGLPDLIRALQATFGANRAANIGITETTRVFTQGLLEAESHNPYTTRWQWRTAFDESVCIQCSPRNNQFVAKGAAGFAGPNDDIVGYPPVHPRCRCGIVALTDAAAAELAQSPDSPATHFRRKIFW
jgi:Phage Mu protein F like protein